VLKCYNLTNEEGEEDPRNNNIPESKGKREVIGPKVEVPGILHTLNTK